MKLFDLSGRVAIVTGGNGGIGLGIAQGLVECGASVVVSGRNAEKSAAAAEQLNRTRAGAAIAIECDVTVPEQVTALVSRTVDQLGGLHIMVNNAGIGIRRRPEEYTLDEYHQLMNTNMTSIFLCCQAAYFPMRDAGGGKIINIGSMASFLGHPYGPIYAASKGAVVQWSRSIAVAWAEQNIQVNCILPGWIDTELTQSARKYRTDLEARVNMRTPAGRWGTPYDLAGLACFLAAPASDYVTGTAIPVDGGYSISMP
ncbi:MAG: glucose 1-dehydrogenase [Chloroflexi bacterium]|nr:glucose 1-dehydrogenase [Chloroflexota bacterium]